jgi:3-ketosteroid 9alpha-monooxygenase subunit A
MTALEYVPGTGSHHGFPYSTRPTGWFQLGWSQDFPTGQAIPLFLFGTDLVAVRTESGRVRLFDAHCPHMGAHLGYGAVVKGDNVSCPFHGWGFDGATGKNVEIPYGKRKCMPGVSLRRWHVHEQAGVVYFWHDSDHVPPQWDPPTPVDNEDDFYPIYPDGVKSWKLRLYPQYIPENGVDFSHFHFAHGAASVPSLASYGEDGHIFQTRIDMTFGGHADTTWLTPDGPVDSNLRTELQGVGLNIARFGTDKTTSLVGITPIDDEYSWFSLTNWVVRDPDWQPGEELPELARRRIAEQIKQAQRDHLIWANMRYRERPPLIDEERDAFRAIRSWAKQFYPGQPEYEERVRRSAQPESATAAVPI